MIPESIRVKSWSDKTFENIAKVCHAANNYLEREAGGFGYLDFDSISGEDRDFLKEAVRLRLYHPELTVNLPHKTERANGIFCAIVDAMGNL